MNELSLMHTASRGIFREFFHRQWLLTAYGLLLVLLTPLMFALQQIDLRTFDGVDLWIKPTKFVFSIAVFALTAAWFFGYVSTRSAQRMEHASHRSRVIVAAGSFEIFYIAWQAGHGLASHFNKSSAFYQVMYALMGLGAVSMVATTPLLAWEIWRRPAPGLHPIIVRRWSSVWCCVLFWAADSASICRSNRVTQLASLAVAHRYSVGIVRAAIFESHTSLGYMPSRQYPCSVGCLAAHHRDSGGPL